MTRTALVVLLLAGSFACRTAGGTTPPVVVAPTPTNTTAASPRTDPDSIRWTRDAAEYRAALLQVYRQATARVEAEASRSRGQGTWAVVLDADETIISNLAYQVERARLGLPYSAESWNAWVKRRAATPLPGAAAFLTRVRALGGRIAIVTNRLAAECADTEAVFKAHALTYDVMLCRPDGAPSDKNPRFEAVGTGRAFGSPPVDIVAFVGDNILDFPRLSQAIKTQGDTPFSEFGVRFFLVPNPMYGSWQ